MKTTILLLLISFSAICQIKRDKIIYSALEVSYISLNALDVISTYKVIENGGYETNPLLTKIVDHPALFIGTKVITTGIFLGSCRLIKKDNTKAAKILLIAGNIGYSFLVNHNFQLTLRLSKNQ